MTHEDMNYAVLISYSAASSGFSNPCKSIYSYRQLLIKQDIFKLKMFIHNLKKSRKENQGVCQIKTMQEKESKQKVLKILLSSAYKVRPLKCQRIILW